MGKLSINLESMAKDVLVEVPPHGLFKNKHVYDVEALDDDVAVGPVLDHKTVLANPNEKEQAPQEIPMIGADLVDTVDPNTVTSEVGTPAAATDTNKKDGA